MSQEQGGEGEVDAAKATRAAEDLVAFFLTLDAAARREYETIIETDKRYGEDVEREARELSQS